MDKLARVKELIMEIDKHNYNYYVLDKPTISDKEWDVLYDELVKLESQLGYSLPNSPTQKVGDVILKGFQKHTHKVKLYSLNKCNSKEEITKWYKDIENKHGKQQYSVECKFDGLQMTVTYNNGMLISAATRGDGSIGEDVTNQAKVIKSIPKTIPYNKKLIVQGEVLMLLSDFENYNKTAQTPLKNARNAAAGGIRNLDPSETQKRNLTMYFYGVNFIEDKDFDSQQQIFDFLKDNGFLVYDYYKIVSGIDALIKEIDYIDNNKKHMDILLDGAVIKLNNVPLRKKIGYTSKFPKWAMAYKFEAQELTSKLKKVTWQVGRTGKLTPIAEIEPVQLAGATVKRATLNNYGDILRKGVKLYSNVFVRRSNEVIPEILGVAEHTSQSIDISKPTHCPSCNSELIEDGANLFCRNDDCVEQVLDRLTHFATKGALNIVGLNEKIVKQLHNELNITCASQLYTISKEELLKLDKFKDKKADNLIKSIQKSKKVDFNRFIYALGISGVGAKTAADLSAHYGNLKALMSTTEQELETINEIGQVLASNIVNYFNNDKNQAFIKRLIDNGVVINTQKVEVNNNSPFYGATVVLTGSMEKYSRDEATQLLQENGAHVTSSVSKKTDYVVAGQSAGSKLTKAQNLGLKVLTEQQFLQMLSTKL